ncbi:MAG: aminotransferase class I/II-fold pyridoxal phosphate-dependent enzyme [Acidimicrobiales bacterium]|nr:aminotransferase class I/II-fold pyridoxal phosphate-dependent enzyme [Acidimicrobiales bacterium]
MMKTDERRLRALKGLKWSKYDKDVLPAWVADMDFAPAPEIVSVIQEMVDLADFGYRYHDVDLLISAWCDWVDRSHGWRPPLDECLTFTSSISALEAAMVLHSEPGDGVVLFSPIYQPFRTAIEQSKRKVVDVYLQGPAWEFDGNRFEDALDSDTRVVLFCQPHNPTGRVYTQKEIDEFAGIVEDHDLLVISDEIWADLTFDGIKHLSLYPNNERLQDRTVTIGSASKAFNLAGARCSVAHIASSTVREELEKFPEHYFGLNSSFGAAATVAAWTVGESWLQEVRIQIEENRNYLHSRINDESSGLSMHLPQATYLAWLDFSNTRLADNPSKRLLEEAKIALEPGSKFGTQCGSYARLNFATSRNILETIADRILKTVNQ